MLKTIVPEVLLEAYRQEVRRLKILAKQVDATNAHAAAEYRRRAGSLEVVIEGYERLGGTGSPK